MYFSELCNPNMMHPPNCGPSPRPSLVFRSPRPLSTSRAARGSLLASLPARGLLSTSRTAAGDAKDASAGAFPGKSNDLPLSSPSSSSSAYLFFITCTACASGLPARRARRDRRTPAPTHPRRTSARTKRAAWLQVRQRAFLRRNETGAGAPCCRPCFPASRHPCPQCPASSAAAWRRTWRPSRHRPWRQSAQ